MPVELEILSGPEVGRRIELSPGAPRTLGWGADANIPLARDAYMNAVHAAIDWVDGLPRVRDLASEHGTFVNDLHVHEQALHDGDRVQVGATLLRVAFVAASASEEAPLGPGFLHGARPPFDDRLAHVRWFLRRHPYDLFALLDAARDGAVLSFLRSATEEFASLYEGWQGENVADVAPYLLRVPAQSELLDELLARGWGNSWGVFLTSEVSFKELRRHLRQFLRVKDADGRALLFRYYDPRVLRAYLPTCTPYETQTFFGPIEAFVIEGRLGESALHVAPTAQGPFLFTESLPEPLP